MCSSITNNPAFWKWPGFHVEISLWDAAECVCVRVCWSLCVTWSGAMNTTVCNLFLFPKKPYCCCNIMKSLLTSYSDWTLFYTLHRWLFIFLCFCFFFLLWFGFSFFNSRITFFFFLKILAVKEKKTNAYLFILCLKTFYFFTVEILSITCLCGMCAYMYVCVRTFTHSYIFKTQIKNIYPNT